MEYYFGYASNMALWVMAELCAEHSVVGVARLPDYKLDFRRFSPGWKGGVGDLVESPGDEVWGVLYQIDAACHDALDAKENYGVGYTSLDVEVTLRDGEKITCTTYSIINKSPETIAPSKYYLETILEGAKEMNLPKDYIARLKAIPVHR